MRNHRVTFVFAVAFTAGCSSNTLDSPDIQTGVTVRNVQTFHQNNKLDLLFMIDDSPSMRTMQEKLREQLPRFMQLLQSAPQGLPDVHIAVVSSDMGAPSDGPVCTGPGDGGIFQSLPRDACAATTLAPGATFLSDTGGLAGGQANFTAPIADVFQCVALLGDKGCGFENQLASIDRALGADGQGPPPPQNAGFLRDDAVLAIVLLTNEDDCSAPADTKLYALNGGPQGPTNPLGPLTGYRCNRFGHLCTNPKTGATGQMPPLTPPTDASGDPPTLALNDCVSNDTDSGLLTPVSKFIADIRALKPGHEDQILVAAIAGPAEPYAVTWQPGPVASEDPWPSVMHSCGTSGDGMTNPDAVPTADGSFGDPAVRIKQFLEGFPNSVFASVCDPSYAGALTALSTRILPKLASPPCFASPVARTASGGPDCSVVDKIFDDASGRWLERPVPNCDENGNQAPCWTLAAGTALCAGQALTVNESAANRAAQSLERAFECSVCAPGSNQPGCN